MQNFKKETEQNPVDTISVVYFPKALLFTETFHGRLVSIQVFSSDEHIGPADEHHRVA